MRDAESFSLIASVVDAPDGDELFRRLQKTAVAWGFEKVLLAGQTKLPTVETPIQHLMRDFPEAYQHIYAARNFILADPALHHCQAHKTPIIWTPSMYSESSHEMMEEASRAGLSGGLSIPVHESEGVKSMLSLARDKPLDEGETTFTLDRAAILANCAHVAANKVIRPKLLEEKRPKLSPRESEIMQYVAQGKGSEVIGDILRISKATVEFHVKNAMAKLGVASRLQGLAHCMAWGLIH